MIKEPEEKRKTKSMLVTDKDMVKNSRNVYLQLVEYTTVRTATKAEDQSRSSHRLGFMAS